MYSFNLYFNAIFSFKSLSLDEKRRASVFGRGVQVILAPQQVRGYVKKVKVGYIDVY